MPDFDLGMEASDSSRSASEGPGDFVPKIGETYVITRSNDEPHEAEIVEKRPRKDGQSGHDYFVHYKELNKRLDEWVTIDRIHPITSSVDLPAKVQRTRSLAASTLLSTSRKSFASVIDDGELERKRTRHQKRLHNEQFHVQKSIDEMDPTTAALEREHEQMTKVKYIERIKLGRWEIDTWYYSPYPDAFAKLPYLFICNYCFKYFGVRARYLEHRHHCKQRLPPGNLEIYRDGDIRVYEVDGAHHKLYCQSLCLLAKLFLDHKTLYYDVGPFMFYILVKVDDYGADLLGYFSKEKHSVENNNLACIMILPPYQRNGYGKFLIQISYEMSAREGKVSSPEKPLSDLGKISYRTFWQWRLVQVLAKQQQTMTVEQLSRMSGIAPQDVLDTMQAMNMTKYWRGHHIVCVTDKIIHDAMAGVQAPKLILKPNQLKWKPKKFSKAPLSGEITHKVSQCSSSR